MNKGIFKWAPAVLGLAFAVCSCEALQGQVIYQDDFSGSGGALHGTTPDVSATGATWRSGSFLADNGVVGSGAFTAQLPFIPQPNLVYTLSVDLNAVSEGGVANNTNWLAAGFSLLESNNLEARFLETSQPALWALSRSDTSPPAERDTSFLGYAGGTTHTAGQEVDPTSSGADRIVITLDTTGADWKWTVDFGGDGVDRMETLASIPTINFVALSNTGTNLGGSTVDNFSLTYTGTPFNTWNVDGGGNFGVAGNWTSGVPAAGSKVVFGPTLSAANAPASVNVNVATSLEQIYFTNPNSYILEGGSTITLTGASTVAISHGSHEIAARLSGSTGLNKTWNGTLTLSNGTNNYTGDTNVTGGVLAVTHINATNLASGAVNVAAGATFRFAGDGMGGGASGNFTEQITGGGTVELANSLTTETINLTVANPGFDGGVLVNGGTLRVSNSGALGSTTGGTTVGGNLSESTLELNNVAVAGEALTIQGRQPSNSTPSLRATGTSSWSGDITGVAGGNQYNISVAAGGNLTLTGNIRTPDDVLPRFLNLSAEAGANGRIEGQIIDRTVAPADGAENPNIAVVKTGPGTWTIATPVPSENVRDAYHQGDTIVEEGTLAIQAGPSDSGELWSRSLIVRSGATLNLSSFNTYSLQLLEDPDAMPSSGDEVGQTLSGSGTVNLGAGKTLAAFDDSIISPGDGVGTLNVTGNFSYSTYTQLATGAWNYDLGATTGGPNDKLVATGSVTVNAGDADDQVNLNIRPVGGTLANGAYALMQGSSAGGTATSANYNIRVLDNQGNDITAGVRQTFNVTNSATAVNFNVSGNSANLNWTGTAGNVWDVGTTSNWSGTGVSQFRQLDNVTFGNVANKNVSVNSNVAPGSVTFDGGAGSIYAVAGSGGMTGFGPVNIQSGTVQLNNRGNDFAGTTTVAAGARLEMASASVGNVIVNGALAVAGSTATTIVDNFDDGNLDGFTTYTVLDQQGGGASHGPPDDVVFSAFGGGITVNGAQQGNASPEQALAVRPQDLGVGQTLVVDANLNSNTAVVSSFGIAIGNSAVFQDVPPGTGNADLRSSYLYTAMTLNPATDGFDSRWVNTSGTLTGPGTTANVGTVTNLWITRIDEDTYTTGYSKDNMSTTVAMRTYAVDWTPDSVGFYADIRGAMTPNAGVLDNLRIVPTSPMLEIKGDLTLGSNAILELDLGVDAFDQIFVTGQATLDGTISVDLAGAFTPAVGREYTVLTAEQGITDLGVVFDLPTNFSASIVDMTRLVLTYGANILQGDFNADGIVDARDYVVWRNNLNGNESALMGNGSGNGTVGIEDYELWKTNFGMTSGGGLAVGAPVPEPATCLLVGLGLASIAFGRRRKK
jgi:autotransporter-associated beta strand protein